jgi:hypothetical protein
LLFIMNSAGEECEEEEDYGEESSVSFNWQARCTVTTWRRMLCQCSAPLALHSGACHVG